MTALKMQLFEYAIVLHPTETGKKNGEVSRLVAGPKPIMAIDPQHASMQAAQEIPEKMKTAEFLARLEIFTRPF